MYSQQGVECREFCGQELTTASAIPVNTVVDLLQTDSAVSRGCKLGKVPSTCENIILKQSVRDPQASVGRTTHNPLLIRSTVEVPVRRVRVAIR